MPTDRDPNAPPAPNDAAAAADAPSQAADAAPRGEASAGPEGGDEAQRPPQPQPSARPPQPGGDAPRRGRKAAVRRVRSDLRWDEADDDEDESAEGAAPHRCGARRRRARVDAGRSERPVLRRGVRGLRQRAGAREPEAEAAKRVLARDARRTEAAQGAGAGRHRLAARHGAADRRRPHHGQRRAGARRPAHLRSATRSASTASRSGAHRAAAARACSPITSRPAKSSRTTTRRTGPRCFAGCRGCSRASGNRSGGWTSTPKACCCSPTRANSPTSLMHPRFGVEREYAVRVLGALDEDQRERVARRRRRSTARRAAFKLDRRRRRRRRQPLVPRGHHRRPQPRGAQAVRGASACRQPADPHPLRLRGAAARPAPRRLGRPGRATCRPCDDLVRRRAVPHSGSQGNGARPNKAQQQPNNRGRGPRERWSAGEGGARERPRLHERAAGQQEPRRHDDDSDQRGFRRDPQSAAADLRPARDPARRAQPRREISEDGPIPNPLQQTYDKRWRAEVRSGSGGGAGNRRSKGGGGGGGGERQPDPMQTSVGYIGADAFHTQDAAAAAAAAGGGGRGGVRR